MSSSMSVDRPMSGSACELSELLVGKSIHHAAPLQYLPSILVSGELIAGSIGAKLGIAPRASAVRRDRMLGVDRYVHLSFDKNTPLLRDKLAKGMPHVVLTFDAGAAYLSEPERCALLPFNTKSWRSRSALQAVADPVEMVFHLRRRAEFGRFPSLEFLVEERLSLAHSTCLTVFDRRDLDMVWQIVESLRPQMSPWIRMEVSTSYRVEPAQETYDFLAHCLQRGASIPLPAVDFD